MFFPQTLISNICISLQLVLNRSLPETQTHIAYTASSFFYQSSDTHTYTSGDEVK